MNLPRTILTEDSFLFYGLPVIKNENCWVIFSPYMKKKIVIENRNTLSDSLYNDIKSNYPAFFGTPKASVNEYYDTFDLTLSLTNNCNLRCKYCFINAGENKKNLSPEEIKPNIDDALSLCEKRKKKNLLISFFGGEPTLQIDLIKYAVDYAKLQKSNFGNVNLSFGITTNGVCKESTLDYLIDNNFYFTVSMDGLPEYQNLHRPLADGTASSASVEYTLKKLASHNIQPRIRVTVTSRNVKSMPDLIRYVAGLGATRVQFEPVTISGRASRDATIKRPAKEDYVRYYIEAAKVASEEGVSIIDADLSRLFKPTLCFCDGMGGACRVVNPDGSISICVEVNSRNHPASEYFLLQSLEEKTLLEQNTITNMAKECRECFAKYICAGGCPSRNFHTTGNVYKPDPYRCYIVKNLIAYVILHHEY